jgi:PadR family transcriptional regulator, regulatory protein PadR
MQGSRLYHGYMAVGRDPGASQLRKGVLELAVLGLLGAEPKYGTQLVEELAAEPALAISAGTVYPLLARLAKGGLVASHWQESPSGPPRKYYTLTAVGRGRKTALASEFSAISEAVTHLLGGLR